MHHFDTAIIDGPIYLHQVGNKLNNDPLVLVKEPLKINNKAKTDLKKYFLSHFKQAEYLQFYHDTSLSLNEVFTYVSSIFDCPDELNNQSRNLALALYRKSTNPNIKSGDLYVAYFKDCLIDGEIVDAVGLFKSESKDSFLKILRKEHSFEMTQEYGININKLDKGCLIFNTQRESGYVVSVVDNSNRKEAKYWIEDFLQVKRRNDGYMQTQNAMSLCKSFISQLPSSIDKAEKALMMNRAIDGLKHELTGIDEIAKHAFKDYVSDFDSFKKEFLETHRINFDDSFQCKQESINKRAIGKMTIIKLDQNFDVNIHGGEAMIERGYDESRGLKFYKLYYNEEK